MDKIKFVGIFFSYVRKNKKREVKDGIVKKNNKKKKEHADERNKKLYKKNTYIQRHVRDRKKIFSNGPHMSSSYL